MDTREQVAFSVNDSSAGVSDHVVHAMISGKHGKRITVLQQQFERPIG
jgi:hypothetical protein